MSSATTRKPKGRKRAATDAGSSNLPESLGNGDPLAREEAQEREEMEYGGPSAGEAMNVEFKKENRMWRIFKLIMMSLAFLMILSILVLVALTYQTVI